MSNKKYKYAVGIDLGTTNSSLSYRNLLEENSATIFLPIRQLYPTKQEKTDTKVPSVVYYKNEQHFVGKGAEEKKYSALRDIDVFYSSKSQLGQQYLYHRSKSPELSYPYQVSGMVLKRIVEAFQETVCENLSECNFVVTVPASFGGSQRSDTLRAIEYAGIPFEEGMLVDEPNAAFVGYIEQAGQMNCPKGSKILVFDMGGGTTDISVIKVNSLEGNIMDLRNIAVSRYDLLGGDDIDAHIASEYLYENLKEQNGIDESEFSFSEKEKIVLSQLKKIAKSLKESLSDKLQWHLDQHGQTLDQDVEWDLFPEFSDVTVTMPDEEIRVGHTRRYRLRNICLDLETLQNLLRPFFSRSGVLDIRKASYNKLSIFSILEAMLSVANLSNNDIDYILPIGGSPRNPLLINDLKEYFENSKMIIPGEMDLLVCKGATVYAYEKGVNSSIPILPVIPDNLGILIHGEEFSTVVKAGVQVPFPKNDSEFAESEVFNLPDDTAKVSIPICIGDKSRIYHNVEIPTHDLEQSIRIGMRLDKDKMLQMKIYSGDDEIPFEFDNPVTVYKSSQRVVNDINEYIYQYRRAAIDYADSVDEKQMLLAASLSEGKRYEEALEHLEALSRKATDEYIKVSALFRLAYINDVKGDDRKAVNYYKNYLDHIPDCPTALLNLGLSYYEQGKKREAMNTWKRSLDSGNPLHSTLVYLGKCMIEENDNVGEAISILSRGIDSILNSATLSRHDIYTLITAYKVMENEEETQKWERKLKEKYEEKKLVYNPGDLLIKVMEDVGLEIEEVEV